MTGRFVLRTVSATLGLALLICPCGATQLVYHPASPTFGGNPLNGSYLLSQSQAQGLGVKSGSQGPDLSGLENSLNNLGAGGGAGSVVVIGGSNGSAGSGAQQQQSPNNSRTIP